MRAVVSWATGRYTKGQDRLIEEVTRQGYDYVHWRDRLPQGCPPHEEVPYAANAYALVQAAEEGYETLLWADACILPIQPLEPLWERIERDGYWISNQAGPERDKGWSNYEWTADSAYPDLFPCDAGRLLGREATPAEQQIAIPMVQPDGSGASLNMARQINRTIPHVVATTFGVSLAHPTGKEILREYSRLASETKAFCGPWTNTAYAANFDTPPKAYAHACGPSGVRGHRHDQTALSVIAWRLGCNLTRWPEVFAYRGHEDERTILVADSSY